MFSLKLELINKIRHSKTIKNATVEAALEDVGTQCHMTQSRFLLMLEMWKWSTPQNQLTDQHPWVGL